MSVVVSAITSRCSSSSGESGLNALHQDAQRFKVHLPLVARGLLAVGEVPVREQGKLVDALLDAVCECSLPHFPHHRPAGEPEDGRDHESEDGLHEEEGPDARADAQGHVSG